MWTKKVVALLVAWTIVLAFPLTSHAANWIVVLRDADDCKMLTDIKAISFKDDGNKWSFKAESYCCWELNYFKLSLTIFINLSGTKRRLDSDYFLEVQSDGEYAYKGYFYNLKTNEVTEIGCDFEKDNSIGTISVNKNLMKLPDSTFSISAFIFNLVERPGTYVDAVPDDQLMIPFEFTPSPPEDKLEVSTREINLGEIKAPKLTLATFQLFNLGLTSLSATISPSANITTDFDQLTLGEYEEKTITITIDTEHLPPRSYKEKVTITTDGGSMEVNVQFNLVPEPLIKVSTSQIDFGVCFNGDNKTEKIIISNGAKGKITGTIGTFYQWIGLDITSFATSSSVELVVSLKALNLPAKVYEGSFSINSDGGTIGISVRVEIVDTVVMDKKEIDFGTLDLDALRVSPIQLSLTNQTNQTLLLDLSASNDWFELSRSSLKLLANEKKEIVIKLVPAKMKEINQRYQGTITIDAPFSIIRVGVSAYLKQRLPSIQWKSDLPGQQAYEDKIITGDTWEKQIRISNGGSGVLEGSARWDAKDTEFRLFNFKFSLKQGEVHELKVKFDAATIKPGVYQNKLLVDSNGGKLIIPCTVEVLPLPDKWIVIYLYIGKTMAMINDKALILESPPYIKQATTMVPLRFISEAFKAKTEWFSVGKGRILISLSGKEIMLDIGKPEAFINGDKLLLQAVPEIKNGRTFVPVRFIAEAFGATVEWNSKEQKILIKMKE